MSSASRVFRFPVFSSSVICENKISPAPAPFTASLKSRAICQSSSRLVMLSRAFSSREHLDVVDEDESRSTRRAPSPDVGAATFSAGCPVMSRKHGRSGEVRRRFAAGRRLELVRVVQPARPGFGARRPAFGLRSCAAQRAPPRPRPSRSGCATRSAQESGVEGNERRRSCPSSRAATTQHFRCRMPPGGPVKRLVDRARARLDVAARRRANAVAMTSRRVLGFEPVPPRSWSAPCSRALGSQPGADLRRAGRWSRRGSGRSAR